MKRVYIITGAAGHLAGTIIQYLRKTECEIRKTERATAKSPITKATSRNRNRWKKFSPVCPAQKSLLSMRQD